MAAKHRAHFQLLTLNSARSSRSLQKRRGPGDQELLVSRQDVSILVERERTFELTISIKQVGAVNLSRTLWALGDLANALTPSVLMRKL